MAFGEGKRRMIGYLPKKVAAQPTDEKKIRLHPDASFLPSDGYNIGMRLSVWAEEGH